MLWTELYFIWTLEACGNRNWIHSMLMPCVYVCNGWTCLIRKQMVIRMSMIYCWLYYCVKLNEIHVKDWMKKAYILRPTIGTLTKSHMMNLYKLEWNSINMGLVYVLLNCYKLYWWILDNTIEDLKWCWKGWIRKTLSNEHMLMFVLFGDEWLMECDLVRFYAHLGWEILVEGSLA